MPDGHVSICRDISLNTLIVLGPVSATHLEDDPRLLQEVSPHVCPADVSFHPEADLDVLPKAAAVIVPGGFSIPDGLHTQREATHPSRTTEVCKAPPW